MNIKAKITNFVKASFNLADLEITRLNKCPNHTLLGLKNRPIHTIIDVGANTGQFAQYISKFFPNAKVYCFEPLPSAFSLLLDWSKTQGNRVIPLNFALGDKTSEVEMFFHEEHGTSSSLLATTAHCENYYPFTKNQQRVIVRQTTLDEAFHEIDDKLTTEILIKLDVQGYEKLVIAGGFETFSKATSCILEVCIDKLYEGQADFNELLMMLKELGYKYIGNLDQAYADDGHCIFLDAVFLRETR